MSEDLKVALIGVFSGVLASSITLAGQWFIKKRDKESSLSEKRENEIRNYLYPLMNSCLELDGRISKIIFALDKDWLNGDFLKLIQQNDENSFIKNPKNKGYFLISSIYLFANFFGCVELIKRTLGSTTSLSKRNNIYTFDPNITRLSKLFQYKELFDKFLEESGKSKSDVMDSCYLHKQFQYSIGELMIENENGSYGIKSFRTFLNEYRTNENFRFWFLPLEYLLSDLTNFPKDMSIEKQVLDKNDIRPLRLMAIRYWCRKLMRDISEEIDIKTPSAYSVISNLSSKTRNSIEHLKLENLDSYFGSNNLNKQEAE